MAELLWLNGEIIPLAEAHVGIEDRGFQFADGVYEVIRLYNRKPFALDQHLQRLQKSAAGILLGVPMALPALAVEIGKFLARASVTEGMIYLQLTRGCAPRSHAFSQTKPTLLFYARNLPPLADLATSEGVKLITVPDERWKRCWIKSIALLPNVLAKNQALAAGADEAVFIENGLVTECSASNIFAVIGRRLKLPVHAVPPETYGPLGPIFAMDQPSSSAHTRETLGWNPTHESLLEDLENIQP